jgi:hypothetical protein
MIKRTKIKTAERKLVENMKRISFSFFCFPVTQGNIQVPVLGSSSRKMRDSPKSTR